MPKIYFGHCVGCDQPIRPPYLSFVVNLNKGPDGNSIESWEDVDVCAECAAKLTAEDLHRLVSAEEEKPGAEDDPEVLDHCEGCDAPLYAGDDYVTDDNGCAGCWRVMSEEPCPGKPCFADRVGKELA